MMDSGEQQCPQLGGCGAHFLHYGSDGDGGNDELQLPRGGSGDDGGDRFHLCSSWWKMLEYEGVRILLAWIRMGPWGTGLRKQ